MQIQLTVNEKGEPMIEFVHYDKRTDLENKLLGVFCKGAIEKGIKINNPAGGITIGEPDKSFEKYTISVNG